jgi:hypothetical protein
MYWASGNGVSPSQVGPSSARHGGARCCQARQGGARRGMGHRRWHGGLRPSLPPSQGWMRHGAARYGAFWRGLACWGLAWLGKGCRQQHGASSEVPCCSLWRADKARPGPAWPGMALRGGARPGPAWPGMALRGGARQGKARQGLTISARRASALPSEFTKHFMA